MSDGTGWVFGRRQSFSVGTGRPPGSQSQIFATQDLSLFQQQSYVTVLDRSRDQTLVITGPGEIDRDNVYANR